MAADLKALTDDPVMVFRARDWNLTEAEAVSHESEYQRMAILAHLLSSRRGALIVPASAALQKLPPVGLLSQQILRLSIGQQMDVTDLARKLAAIGYESVRLTDGVGQFAHRGDIVDFVPSEAEAEERTLGIRVSFFDREIDAIKSFDLDSQRSIQMHDAVMVAPVREVLDAAMKPDYLADQLVSDGHKAILEARQNGVGAVTWLSS